MIRVPAKIYPRFGANLRSFRLARGYTQERLAEIADVHWTFISKVERGVVNISLKNIIRLSLSLKCKPEELIAGTI